MKYSFERLTTATTKDPFGQDYAFIGVSGEVDNFIYGDRRYAWIDGEEETSADAYFDGSAWVDPAHFDFDFAKMSSK